MSPSGHRIELASRAVRDLRRIDRPTQRRVQQALNELAAGLETADVKPLVGVPPWMRLRVGDWRVLYRPLSAAEAADDGPGLLVARVVNRRDLLRAVRTLNL